MSTVSQTASPFVATELAPPSILALIQRRSLFVAIAASIATVLYLVIHPQGFSDQFLRSYLLGFMLWLGLTMGCLALLMLQYVATGMWGFVMRRPLEAASRNLPLMGVLFIPLLWAMWAGKLYSWRQALSAEDKELWKFRSYLRPEWWTLRAAICFAIWIVIMFLLNRWGARQDTFDEDPFPRRSRYRQVAGPGLVLYAITITIAAIDWVMSLDPHWFSTIYGFIFIDGQVLSAFSFVTVMLVLLVRYRPMSVVMQPDYFHDLGKFTLAFIMVWGYFTFSQFLIIWMGNLPEEIHWYLDRFFGGWQFVFAAIWMFHFALPFILLLSRNLKRQWGRLVFVSCFIFFMRYVDLFFYIAPNFPDTRRHFHYSWLDAFVPIAIGGLWLASFFYQLQRRPLVPVYSRHWATWRMQNEH